MADTFKSRWGDSELDDQQYIHMPGYLLRQYHKFTFEGERVGLGADEFQALAHIMSFKFDVAGAVARPSLQTVADQMGKHVSSVRRTVKKMENKKAVKIDRPDGKPSIYDFGELVRQCKKFEKCIDATPSVDASTPLAPVLVPPLASTLAEDLEVKSKKEELEDIAPEALPSKPDDSQSDAKAPTDHQLMFQAVCDALRLDVDTLTKDRKGTIGKTATQLRGAKAKPENMRGFIRWLKAKAGKDEWSGDVTENAMRKYWPDYAKTLKPCVVPHVEAPQWRIDAGLEPAPEVEDEAA